MASAQAYSYEATPLSNEYYQVKAYLENNIDTLNNVYQSSYSVFSRRLLAIAKKCEVLDKKQSFEKKGEIVLKELRVKSKDKNYKPQVTSKYDQLGLVSGSHLKIVEKRNTTGNQNLIHYTRTFQNWIATISSRVKTSFGKDKGIGLMFSNVAEEVDQALDQIKEQIQSEHYSNCQKQVSFLLETRERK